SAGSFRSSQIGHPTAVHLWNMCGSGPAGEPFTEVAGGGAGAGEHDDLGPARLLGGFGEQLQEGCAFGVGRGGSVCPAGEFGEDSEVGGEIFAESGRVEGVCRYWDGGVAI